MLQTAQVRVSTYYQDLREYLAALEQHGWLRRVTRPINKDTELHALARLQFRGLPAEERSGWLFEQVVDARGRRYDQPVAVGCLASNKAIYALGLNCTVDAVPARWERALAEPIPPVMVPRGACQEVVWQGSDLLANGGLDAFPFPISTPGLDNAPYLTAGHVLTKDYATGQRNLGNYRCMVKAPDRLGCLATVHYQDGGRHWKVARALRRPLEVAVVIGTIPAISYAASARVGPNVEEFAVAGGLAGTPVELVQCVSVDLAVPAHAEIVIEGVIPTDHFELEGPFGEYTGYMATRAPMMYIDVTAITMRRAPIVNAFVSQYPPSESTVLRAMAREPAIKKLLADAGLTGILRVALLEELGCDGLLVVQVDRRQGAKPRDVLRVLAANPRFLAKYAVVVDDDIDPHDTMQVWHAISWRAFAPRDVYQVPLLPYNLDPSAAPPGQREDSRLFDTPSFASLMIDATRKWPYPPISLPTQEHMEHALLLWSELGLPDLTLQAPWYGYALDDWSEEEAAEAALAVQGRYFETGEKFARQRIATDDLGL